MRPSIVSVATLLIASVPGSAATIQVHPGESIQSAVDRADPGDTIAVLPGTYRESGRRCPTDSNHLCGVVVTKDDLRLLGLASPGHPVVLENAGGQDQGISIAKPGATGRACLNDRRQRIHGATVEGFTVNDFAGEGIALFCVDDFLVLDSAANGNGEYGIFPSHSGPGRVTGCVATGSNDTGIYVGVSHDVRVDHNTAQGNVSGFEIENSSGVVLDNNLATGDTAGILTFALPGLDINSNHDNEIRDNTVLINNKANTCTPPDEVCSVPVGTGILMLAVQRNVARHNVVLGNDTFGIALSDLCTANQLPPEQCSAAVLGIDPFPNDNRIEHNVVLGNGLHPDHERLPPGIPGADLLWTGLGRGNCWSHNESLINVWPLAPLPLPPCP
jgi:parallel beta-helix repeat protein